MSKMLFIIKEFRSNPKNNTLWKLSGMLVVAAVLSTWIFLADYSENVNKGLADNLIRLHVIANSDSEEDQALKREIRDSIIAYMEDRLKGSKDIEQTKYIINKEIGNIQKLAADQIAKNGESYTVNTMVGSYPFPTKTYGDVSLPAGNYQALRVVIGKGEGSNWWCVLFPPLCFVDATHGIVPDSVKQNLKNALSEEEYNIITAANTEDEIPVKLKFKIVEFFQDSKIKFSGAVSRIFK